MLNRLTEFQSPSPDSPAIEDVWSSRVTTAAAYGCGGSLRFTLEVEPERSVLRLESHLQDVGQEEEQLITFPTQLAPMLPAVLAALCARAVADGTLAAYREPGNDDDSHRRTTPPRTRRRP